MASLNRATLMGNLGKDPKVATLNSGGKVVTFSLATSESWKDKTTGERRERTQWHNVVIFNEGLGDIAAKYLKKGSRALVEGQIETRKYTDQSGAERYTTEIVLRPYQGLLTLLDKAERATPGPDDYGTTRTRDAAPPMGSASSGGETFHDDDIPF